MGKFSKKICKQANSDYRVRDKYSIGLGHFGDDFKGHMSDPTNSVIDLIFNTWHTQNNHGKWRSKDSYLDES